MAKFILKQVIINDKELCAHCSDSLCCQPYHIWEGIAREGTFILMLNRKSIVSQAQDIGKIKLNKKRNVSHKRDQTETWNVVNHHHHHQQA